jgi:hypothetical protein
MNTAFDMQFEEDYTFTLGCRGKCICNGKYLNDLWRGGRCTYDEIVRLTAEFFKAVNSHKNKDVEGLRRLESLFLGLKVNWIRLDGLLRCVEYFPCKCTMPTAADEMMYLEHCEEAWKKFHFCSELLIGARIKTGQIDSSEGGEFMWNAARLKSLH